MDVIILMAIILPLGIRCILGAISKTVNEKNGYFGGFAWGFWLGIIGIIVVAVRQPPFYHSSESIIIPEHGKKLPASAISEEDAPNGWHCRCGRYNAQYVSSCVCGISKREAMSPQPEVVEPDDEMKKIAALKEYQKLLEDGIITQDEFDAKKKAILSE